MTSQQQDLAYAVIDAVDALLCAGKFTQVDNWMRNMSVATEPDVALIAMLTATNFPDSDVKLPSRTTFRARVEAKMSGRDDVDDLLRGL